MGKYSRISPSQGGGGEPQTPPPPFFFFLNQVSAEQKSKYKETVYKEYISIHYALIFFFFNQILKEFLLLLFAKFSSLGPEKGNSS